MELGDELEMQSLRQELEQSRIDHTLLSDDYKQLTDSLEQLRKWKAEVEQYYRDVMCEPCDLNMRHCTCVPALRQKVKELESTLRDFRDNFDCDGDAHKYGTTCRKCSAKLALEE